jgi:hypothetical protein
MINLIVALLSFITPVDSTLRPAVRVGNMYQETPLPPPPLNPEGLIGCQEMEWYRSYVGLPEIFDGLGWRESNCRNDVRTFCCYGYWQIYISLWLQVNSSYREHLIDRCGITGVASIYGLSDRQKLANACAVKVAYDISGLTPWRLG